MAQPTGTLTHARPIIFGEVLFDQFPDGSVILGGAPFNVAWHLQAFGARPLMISRIGNDPLGRDIRDTMLAWGMDSSGMQLDSLHPTGTVTVSFDDGEPVFDIVAKRAYDFIEMNALPPLPENGVIYHGSLALREDTSRNALSKLKQLALAPVFVDINLRAPWWTDYVIEQVLLDAKWLKLNTGELNTITQKSGSIEDRISQVLHKSRIQYLVVTQGDKGALLAERNGDLLHVDTNTATQVVDTVGAGDAFSSILLLGYIKGWSLMKTLQRAQEFANAIVGIRGATSRNSGLYQPFIEAWQLA